MRSALPFVALTLLAGCTGGGQTPAPGTRVTGRLVDDETGRPVERTSIWVHAFDDATKEQVSLAPSDGTGFDLTMSGPAADGRRIRLRVPDLSNAYELWEKTFAEKGGALDVEVRLVPTHWVRLHGRVLWRDGDALRPIREGGDDVRSARVTAGRVGLRPDEDGDYSVRAPRELLRVLLVNANCSATPEEIDLSGFQGDEFEQDVILAK